MVIFILKNYVYFVLAIHRKPCFLYAIKYPLVFKNSANLLHQRGCGLIRLKKQWHHNRTPRQLSSNFQSDIVKFGARMYFQLCPSCCKPVRKNKTNTNAQISPGKNFKKPIGETVFQGRLRSSNIQNILLSSFMKVQHLSSMSLHPLIQNLRDF